MRLSQLQEVTRQNRWRSVAEALVKQHGHKATQDFDSFETHWIEAGHHIRQQIADDDLLIQMLRLFLRPYTGNSVSLYRGENLTRWQARIIGLAWTSKADIARMFGRGLNAISSGGVLLVARFPSSAILSGPSRHSQNLGEEQFTVDPRLAVDLQVLEQFPPT